MKIKKEREGKGRQQIKILYQKGENERGKMANEVICNREIGDSSQRER
jgi:hypothetical protein